MFVTCANSAFDKASEQDFDKLHAKFVEYATKKKRNNLIKLIETKPKNDSLSSASNLSPLTVEKFTTEEFDRYKQFRTLFSIGTKNVDADEEEIIASLEKHELKIFSNTYRDEKALDIFIKQNHGDSSSAEDELYFSIERNARELRREFYQELRRNPDAYERQRRAEDELKSVSAPIASPPLHPFIHSFD